MPSRMRRSLTSILSCTGVKCAWKALPRPPIEVTARPLEAVAATLGCGGATCEQISHFKFFLRIAEALLKREVLVGSLAMLRPASLGKKAVARWSHDRERSLILLSSLLTELSPTEELYVYKSILVSLSNAYRYCFDTLTV